MVFIPAKPSWVALPFALAVLGVGGALVTLGALSGCATSSAATAPAVAPTSTKADDEAAADVIEHHRHHHHGGVTLFIAMSVDTLGVSTEQRAQAESIQTDLQTKMEPARAAEENVVAVLADGVAAGAIDGAKVDAALAQVSAAAGAVHDATADALNQLHALLTPEQRTALVDKVEAHWALWQRANGGDDADGARKGGGAGHLDALTKELALTPDQVEKIRTSLASSTSTSTFRADPQKVETFVQAFGAAFKADAFDAKALSTAGPANAHLALWGATHLAHVVESATPVLTPEQRATLAKALREHQHHREHDSVAIEGRTP